MTARQAAAQGRRNSPPIAPGAGRPARGGVATIAPLEPPDHPSLGRARPGRRPEAGATDFDQILADDPADGDPDWARYLRCEVLLDVLVVTILTPCLGDDRALLDPIHRGLVALSRRPLPHRVVVDLFYVTTLSVTALAVLVAHAQRLAGAGGALRLSHVGPGARATLDRIRLSRPLATYPRLDDAVATGWGTCAGAGQGRPG